MEFDLKYHRYHLLSVILVIWPALCYSDDAFTCTRATYYGSPDCLGTPKGACGFGEYGRTVNYGNVAGVSRLFKGGSGCGGCYQVRCKVAGLCTDEGVNVVVTDYGEGHHTDFIMSPRAYSNLARSPDASKELFAYGVVEVEYRRIPCQFSNYDIQIKINEHSKYPHYLAIVILYVAGQNEILAVEVWQEDRKEWITMRRAYGAVFDLANPPTGPLTMRFQVSGSAGDKWIVANNVIPSDWQVGVAYDSTIQLN